MTDDWNLVKNVLCIRLDTIGDVLMTTPAIRAVKESHPSRRITLLTSKAGAATGLLVPEVDDVIIYDAPWLKATSPRTDSSLEYKMAKQLRRSHFDAAIIFTVYSQNPLPSAFLCYLADIPLRLAHCHENPYQLLTHWVKDPEPESFVRHEVRRQLDLVATVGCQTVNEGMSIRASEQAACRVQDIIQELSLERWAVIHPGATAPSRRYPPEGFASVARHLVNLGISVVFTGTEPERELIEAIKMATGVPTHSLVGKLDLGELVALLAIAPVLIANNTGPVHIAAALGTPVVDLYALTNPQHTPWGVSHRVLFHDVPCKYCYKSICPQVHHNCLQLVTPESVVRATCELLDL